MSFDVNIQTNNGVLDIDYTNQDGENNSISVSNNDTVTIKEGSDITVSANADDHYILKDFEVNTSETTIYENSGYYNKDYNNQNPSQDTTQTINIEEDATIEGVFVRDKYFIDIIANEHGSIKAEFTNENGTEETQTIDSSDYVVVQANSDISLTGNADEEYIFKKFDITTDGETNSFENDEYYDFSINNLYPEPTITNTISANDNIEVTGYFNRQSHFIKIYLEPYSQAEITHKDLTFNIYDNSGNKLYSEITNKVLESNDTSKEFYLGPIPSGTNFETGDISINTNKENYIVDSIYEAKNINDFSNDIQYNLSIGKFEQSFAANNEDLDLSYSTYKSEFDWLKDSDAFIYYGLEKFNIVRILESNIEASVRNSILDENENNYGVLVVEEIIEDETKEIDVTYTYELKNPNEYNTTPKLRTLDIPGSEINNGFFINNLSENRAIKVKTAIGKSYANFTVPNGCEVLFNDTSYSEDFDKEIEFGTKFDLELIINNEDVIFDSWKDTIINSNNEEIQISSYTDDSLSNKKITVNYNTNMHFKPLTYKQVGDITIIQPSHGEIYLNNGLYSNSAEDIKMIKASADYGYNFVKWKGSYEGKEEKQILFKATEPKTFSAEIEKQKDFSININSNIEDYNINIKDKDNNEYSEDENFEFGKTLFLSISEPENYKFINWSGDISSSKKEVEIKVGKHSSQNYITSGNEKKVTNIKLNFVEIKDRETININTMLMNESKESDEKLGSIEPFIGEKYKDEFGKTITLKAKSSSSEDNGSTYNFKYWENQNNKNKLYNNIIEVDLNDTSNNSIFTAVFEKEKCDINIDKKIVGDGDISNCYLKYTTKNGTEYNGINDINEHFNNNDFYYKDNLSLIANADHGYVLDHWLVNDKEETSSLNFNLELNNDKNVVAVFKKDSFPLKIKTNDNYKIDVEPDNKMYDDNNDLYYIFDYETEVTLKPTINNKRFISWDIPNDSKNEIIKKNESELKFIIREKTNIGINLDDYTNDFYIDKFTGGSVEVNSLNFNSNVSNPNDKTKVAEFETDKVVSLIANNDNMYKFSKWIIKTIDDEFEYTSPNIEYFVNEDITATPVFETSSILIKVETEGSGYIINQDTGNEFNRGSYKLGDIIKLKAVPLSVASFIYKFSHWENKDGEKIGDSSEIEVVANKSKSIVAKFEKFASDSSVLKEIKPIMQIRNHRKNGPIESIKYNSDINEAINEINLINNLLDQQESTVDTEIMDKINDIQNKKQKIKKLEQKLSFLKERVERGGDK